MPEPFRALEAPMALTEIASLEHLEERHLLAYLGALSEVLHAAAHDLRGPLHTIALQLELLRQSTEGVPDADLRARQEKHLEGLLRETKRLRLMLDALWGDDAGVGGSFDLRGTAEELQALLEPYCRRNRIRLSVRLHDSGVDVLASPRFVRHAAMDLFLQALGLAQEEGEIELVVDRAGQVGQLKVTGSPKPERGAPKLERWGDDDGAGTWGAVARRIAARYGGRVVVETAPGRYPLFQLELPLSITRSPGNEGDPCPSP